MTRYDHSDLLSHLRIVTLCTGNVARSVMLGHMLSALGEADGLEWRVRTAGTRAVDRLVRSDLIGHALGSLDELGVDYAGHQGHQLSSDDAAWADVILAAEANHVLFVRDHHPGAAARTVQLGLFARYAPLDAPFGEQLAETASREPDPDVDVADPLGGDQSVYDACAHELWELAQVFTLLAIGDQSR